MKLALAVLLAVIVAGGPRQDATVQILVVGVIKKIDSKAGALTVSERIYPDRRSRRGPATPDLGPGFPPPESRGRRGAQQIDTKILYSAETSIKSSEKPLVPGDLKVGDSIRITGTPSNKGIVAKEIERLKAAQ